MYCVSSGLLKGYRFHIQHLSNCLHVGSGLLKGIVLILTVTSSILFKGYALFAMRSNFALSLKTVPKSIVCTIALQ
jgi:hypothetical protein